MNNVLFIYHGPKGSYPLFAEAAKKSNLDTQYTYYSSGLLEYDLRSVQAVYLRDPFYMGAQLAETDINRLNGFLARAAALGIYIVDGIKTYDDLLIEDKWRQYQLYQDFMPNTYELIHSTDFTESKQLIKQRLSSRARGVLYQYSERSKECGGSIIQDIIHTQNEYRVYVINGEVMPVVSVKSPKTIHQKTRLIGITDIPRAVREFVQNIIPIHPFDFVGYDIADTGDQLYLLEANRSCVFNAYYRRSGINLAETFFTHLQNKLH